MNVRDILSTATRSAVISDCGRLRYRLRRRWAKGQAVLFVMLNPSTADAEVDDATIRRCAGFAHRAGYAGFEVVNLFAYRATDPTDLRRAGYPVGPDNDDHIVEAAMQTAAACLAWGSNAAGLERPQIVLPMLRRVGGPLLCLRITRSGHPQHPLRLPSACTMMPFTEQAIEEAMS